MPNRAGGANVTMARAVGPKLAEKLMQQLIIDNGPGAVRLGMALVAKAPAGC